MSLYFWEECQDNDKFQKETRCSFGIFRGAMYNNEKYLKSTSFAVWKKNGQRKDDN